VNPRSLLFVPGDRPERVGKALATAADIVIVDLEDAVAADAKPAAREVIRRGWSGLEPGARARVAIRINAMDTPWHAEDTALAGELAGAGLRHVVLPKCEAVAHVQSVATVSPLLQLLPLIESAEGLAAIDRLARCPGVARLVFGHLDFQLDLGMECSEDERELDATRLQLVIASRRANLPPPVDGVTVQVQDSARLQADCERGRRFGFGGKLCIHPRQVDGVNRVFAPTPAQQDWARRVLEASHAHGQGAFMFDGSMVDAPVLARARRYLSIN
jgi:citrate lyase subunit beta/citryl-CoA lyase